MQNNTFKTVKSTEAMKSITFKVTETDRARIVGEAAELNMGLSDYIRLKLLLQEPELKIIIKENKKLRKFYAEAQVRKKANRKTDIEEDCITIQVSSLGKKLLEDIFNDSKQCIVKLDEDFAVEHEDLAGFFISHLILNYYSNVHPEYIKGIMDYYGIKEPLKFHEFIFPYYIGML